MSSTESPPRSAVSGLKRYPTVILAGLLNDRATFSLVNTGQACIYTSKLGAQTPAKRTDCTQEMGMVTENPAN